MTNIFNVLLLGGTSDAIKLVKSLVSLIHSHNIHLIYSIAGTVRKPKLDYTVIEGGFSQYADQYTPYSDDTQGQYTFDSDSQRGLAYFITQRKIHCILDCTHPYATQISHNAFEVSQALGVRYLGYHRPNWSASDQDRWIPAKNWPHAKELLSQFKRPFVTIGQSAVRDTESISENQFWLIRSAIAEPMETTRFKIVRDIGPFVLKNETALMQQHKIDVLVCKNSGGKAVDTKLQAARQLNIPVILLERPDYRPEIKQHFRDNLEALIEKIKQEVYRDTYDR